LNELLLRPDKTPKSIWKTALAVVRQRRIKDWEDAFTKVPELRRAFEETVEQIDWDLNAEEVVTAYDADLAMEIKQGLNGRPVKATTPNVPRRSLGGRIPRFRISTGGRIPNRRSTIPGSIPFAGADQQASISVVGESPSLENVITEYLEKQKQTDISYKDYFAIVRRGRDMVPRATPYH
jgi:hypothetical protein